MNFPFISRNPSDVLRLRPSPLLGLDFEWDTHYNRPTILGLSDGLFTVSGRFEDIWPMFPKIINDQTRLVGHNFVQADYKVLNDLGSPFPLDRVEDTIIWHWLNNPHLCKVAGKQTDDESERRGRGFMNLYAAMSLELDVPNWKECVGERQCYNEGRPCPTHSVFDYNGNDAYWPVLALPKMKQRAALRGVDGQYPLHRDVSFVLGKMTERGIMIDTEYVKNLEAAFRQARGEIYDKETGKGTLGFNPDSPKQVIAAFRELGISLPNTQQETVESVSEKYPDSAELMLLRDWKSLGDGGGRWFAPREWNPKKQEWEGYVDEEGFIHPSFGLFASSGRLTSSRPNCQNIIRDKEVRRAVIAPKGYLIYEADLKSAEDCSFLYEAGYHDLPVGIDIPSWLRDEMGITEEHPLAKKEGSARQGAKTIAHACKYGEGLSLITKKQLNSALILREEQQGARIIFRDWCFDDGGQTFFISFTGAHLADRAFGNHGIQSRRLALEVQEKYFSRFPKVRQLQRRITAQIEKERCVRPPSGLVTPSYGYPADRIKSAFALWGSQPVAHWTKLAMLKSEEIMPKDSLRAQIHDALFWYVKKDIDKARVKDMIVETMKVEIKGMEGMVIPCEVACGLNWADKETI